MLQFFPCTRSFFPEWFLTATEWLFHKYHRDDIFTTISKDIIVLKLYFPEYLVLLRNICVSRGSRKNRWGFPLFALSIWTRLDTSPVFIIFLRYKNLMAYKSTESLDIPKFSIMV